jgi:putative nucleotidyltransferase with HDIG domain/PAS domain S-box-containing protein
VCPLPGRRVLDAELASEALTKAGYDVHMDWAPGKGEYEAFLAGGDYDIILADYSLPGFDARAALALAQAACATTPFICVSGMIGEEATVELLKQGADDCVLKDHLSRLPSATQRAIDECARQRALEDSERRYTSLFENLLNGFAYCKMVYDEQGEPVDFVYLDVNPAFERITHLKDVVGRPVSEVIPGLYESNRELFELYGRVASSGEPEALEFCYRPLSIWLFIAVNSTERGSFVAVFEDITERHDSVENLRLSAEHLSRTVEGAVKAMGAMVAARDPYTAGHELRVTQLVVAIAAEMGLAAAVTDGLRLAALVHDIGKLTVPSQILSKPMRLRDVEFALIKEHPREAYAILESVDFERPVAEIVLQHHERLDGSGYPRGLEGDAILPEARVLAVADVLEAMASHRPYRAALGVEAAFEELRAGAGSRYDADAVAACEHVFAQGFVFEEAVDHGGTPLSQIDRRTGREHGSAATRG